MSHKKANSGFIKSPETSVPGRNLCKIAGICILIVSLFALSVSCKQDSIFADIAVEPPPVKPKIPGTPVDIVVCNDTVYMSSIGSSTIYCYKNQTWDTLKLSNKDRIAGLASSGADSSGELYALVYTDDRIATNLKKYNWSTGKWVKMGIGDAASHSLQSLYSAGGKIFAGGRENRAWNVFYLDDANKLTLLVSDTAPLTGAAFDTDYFISTGGKGIYLAADLSIPPVAPVAGSEDKNVTGIINVNGKITAVTRAGDILAYDGSEFESLFSDGPSFTGAMTIWKSYEGSQWKDTLLLLGVQTTGYKDKGYREMILDSSSQPQKIKPIEPGILPSSIKPADLSKYEASLARHSVHYMLQVPDEVDPYPRNSSNKIKDPKGWEPLIFAATTKDGIFVLKKGVWNAQD